MNKNRDIQEASVSHLLTSKLSMTLEEKEEVSISNNSSAIETTRMGLNNSVLTRNTVLLWGFSHELHCT